jgi:hypothetical protein
MTWNDLIESLPCGKMQVHSDAAGSGLHWVQRSSRSMGCNDQVCRGDGMVSLESAAGLTESQEILPMGRS